MNICMNGEIDMIVDRIYLGNAKAGENKARLDILGITHIVICSFGISPQFPQDFTYYCMDTMDDPNQNILVRIPGSNNFLKSALEQGATVLLFCLDGIAISSSFCTALIMAMYGMSFPSALALVKLKRPVCHPNNGFQNQLAEYEKTVRKMFKSPVKNTVTKHMGIKEQDKYNLFKPVKQEKNLIEIGEDVRHKLKIDQLMDICSRTNIKAGGIEETMKGNKLEKMNQTKVLDSQTPIKYILKTDLIDLANQNVKDSGLKTKTIAQKISTEMAQNYFGKTRTEDLQNIIHQISQRKNQLKSMNSEEEELKSRIMSPRKSELLQQNATSLITKSWRKKSLGAPNILQNQIHFNQFSPHQSPERNNAKSSLDQLPQVLNTKIAVRNRQEKFKTKPGKIYKTSMENKLKQVGRYDQIYHPDKNKIGDIENKKFIMAKKELEMQQVFQNKLQKAILEPEKDKGEIAKTPFFCKACDAFLFNMFDILDHGQPSLEIIDPLDDIRQVTSVRGTSELEFELDRGGTDFRGAMFGDQTPLGRKSDISRQRDILNMNTFSEVNEIVRRESTQIKSVRQESQLFPQINNQSVQRSNRISCCEYFVVQKPWMKLEGDYGDLRCPKKQCQTKLGVFNEKKGIVCTCGTTVKPGFLLYKSKIRKNWNMSHIIKEI